MSDGLKYNPIPPRAWSRVQDPCVYTENSTYESVYIPLTKQTIPLAQANYEKKLYYKGNILQYKANSSSLTKKQRYSQIAKGQWTNRTKTWATQGVTYTNPNNSSLKRVDSIFYSYPNNLINQPNNPAGPFVVDVPNPFGCKNNLLEDGGILICNTYVNPCTEEVIQRTRTPLCYPASASDVPGESFLCWNNKLSTFYPRQRYIMPTSGSKWPINYKLFTSAVKPAPPIVKQSENTPTSITISWEEPTNLCYPVTSFNIYLNNTLLVNIPNETPYTYTINITNSTNVIYMTSLLGRYESTKSNELLYNT
jgi:hypothetical protein